MPATGCCLLRTEIGAGGSRRRAPAGPLSLRRTFSCVSHHAWFIELFDPQFLIASFGLTRYPDSSRAGRAVRNLARDDAEVRRLAVGHPAWVGATVINLFAAIGAT